MKIFLKIQVGVLKWPKSIPSRNFWFIMRNNLRLSILIINLTLFVCFQSIDWLCTLWQCCREEIWNWGWSCQASILYYRLVVKCQLERIHVSISIRLKEGALQSVVVLLFFFFTDAITLGRGSSRSFSSLFLYFFPPDIWVRRVADI